MHLSCSMRRSASATPYKKYSILTKLIFSCSLRSYGFTFSRKRFIWPLKNSSASCRAYGPKCILLRSNICMNSVPFLSRPARISRKLANSFRCCFLKSSAAWCTSVWISYSKLMVVLLRRFSVSISDCSWRSLSSSARFLSLICLSNSVS